MSTRYTIEGSTLQGIANAIRTKNGSAEEYTPAEMIDAINALDLESGGVDPDALELTVDEDGLAEVVLEGEVIKSKQIDSSVDEDLVAENIREGKNIFGVDGSMPALQENYEVVGGTFEPADYIDISPKYWRVMSGDKSILFQGQGSLNADGKNKNSVVIRSLYSFQASDFSNYYDFALASSVGHTWSIRTIEVDTGTITTIFQNSITTDGSITTDTAIITSDMWPTAPFFIEIEIVTLNYSTLSSSSYLTSSKTFGFPEQPTENMICAPSYSFSGAVIFANQAPSKYLESLGQYAYNSCWIKTGEWSPVEVDLYGNSKVIINPQFVCRNESYFDWIPLDAWIYKNDEWIQLGYAVIANGVSGNIYLGNRLRNDSSLTIEYQYPDDEDGNAYCEVKTNGNVTNGAATSEPIDVTPYSTLTMRCNVIAVDQYMRMGLANTLDTSSESAAISSVFKYVQHQGTGITTLVCDISDVSGSYYPCVLGANSTSTLTVQIYDFYLT